MTIFPSQCRFWFFFNSRPSSPVMFSVLELALSRAMGGILKASITAFSFLFLSFLLPFLLLVLLTSLGRARLPPRRPPHPPRYPRAKGSLSQKATPPSTCNRAKQIQNLSPLWECWGRRCTTLSVWESMMTLVRRRKPQPSISCCLSSRIKEGRR